MNTLSASSSCRLASHIRAFFRLHPGYRKPRPRNTTRASCSAASCTTQLRAAWAESRDMPVSSAPPMMSPSMHRVSSTVSPAVPAVFRYRKRRSRRWLRPSSPPPERLCAASAGTSTRPTPAIAAHCSRLVLSVTPDSPAPRCGSTQSAIPTLCCSPTPFIPTAPKASPHCAAKSPTRQPSRSASMRTMARLRRGSPATTNPSLECADGPRAMAMSRQASTFLSPIVSVNWRILPSGTVAN